MNYEKLFSLFNIQAPKSLRFSLGIEETEAELLNTILRQFLKKSGLAHNNLFISTNQKSSSREGNPNWPALLLGLVRRLSRRRIATGGTLFAAPTSPSLRCSSHANLTANCEFGI